MHAFVEIVGPGNADSSSSVQIFFDEARYLFECGDGTQRLCTEYGIKLGRVRGVYVTSLAAPSIGGLFGLFLTIADAGKEKLSITGPDGLKQLFSAARGFCCRPALKEVLQEVVLESPVEKLPVEVTHDENITIEAVPIRGKRNIEIDSSFGAHYDSLTYVCRMHDLRGKFDPERAMKLGVKKGRNFGILQKGGHVTLDNGSVVQSCEVMSPSTPGPVVIIAACPSVHHVDSFVTSRFLQPAELGIKASGDTEKPMRVAVVCHLGPKDVLEHPEYRMWCDSLGSDTSHIPLHSSVAVKRTIFTSQAEDLALLHHSVDKELFPLPEDAYQGNVQNSVDESRKEHNRNPPLADVIRVKNMEQKGLPEYDQKWAGKWIESDCRMKFILSPSNNSGPDFNSVRSRHLTPKVSHPLRPWRKSPSFHSAEPLPESPLSSTPQCIMSLPPRTVAVRFLGTGAAIPGKHRNVSSVMLDMFERGGVLLDCGEGTWGQLVRHFGTERAQRVLCRMKVIFISHMHADHHLGTLRLLHERTNALRIHEDLRFGPQLVIIGPVTFATWLEAFQTVAKVPQRDRLPAQKRSFIFHDAKSLTDPQSHDTRFFEDSFGIRVGCVAVDHCPLSYGVIIEDVVRTWKMVYSGDTRPCEELARAGRGATLAIHEATLEDSLAEEARAKMHSTTSDALDICAVKMMAWRTILTHFSQRYPKLPRLTDKVLQKLSESRASVAFDLMCIDFTRLADLPNMVPVLRDTFPDAFQETDQGLERGTET